MNVRKVRGARVRRARRGADMKQSELGSALGVGQPFVSKVENGDMTFSPFDYPAVADLLDVSVLELLGPLTAAEKRLAEMIKKKLDAAQAESDLEH